MNWFSRKKPSEDSALSEFMRNAPAREQKRVFKKVIEQSIAEQRKVIEKSEALAAAGGHARMTADSS
ncbi:MAG: hypothetical protein MPK11_04935 [Gammaproteobacteria bacterium]|nr:hypothetical protein [Gammaproteobacteria bacterium]MDA7970102.1 hypothetical protein [Gammaproteobacteria bacterium]MDA7971733.1 hypothetical protein [Gammaproteobacteria bacterium]MDA7995830.1 hypothetical protein [Gammaproteobacteria bacterium]